MPLSCCRFGNYGHRSDFKEIFQHIGVPFKQETKGEWIRTIADHSGVFIVPVQNIKNLIPDVRGMGLRDAMFLLDDYGIKAIPVGRGKIVRQSKDPGSIISNENLILYLE
ncbi:MAG: PASTA domain-containing protein [Saprospiraceae bacterium]|nr:PASTA domain-containing protein [Saprospiraceae bacterium]